MIILPTDPLNPETLEQVAQRIAGSLGMRRFRIETETPTFAEVLFAQNNHKFYRFTFTWRDSEHHKGWHCGGIEHLLTTATINSIIGAQ